MAKVPELILQYLSNAEYYLEAADKLSPPQGAAHILLLIAGWENAVLAEQELSSWSTRQPITPKIHKDHATKLDFIDPQAHILRVIVGEPGTHTPIKEVYYKTGKELKGLMELCRYGSATETRDVRELFRRHWFADSMRNNLSQKIERIRFWVPLYESADEAVC